MMRKILTFVLPIGLAACAAGPQVTPVEASVASAAKADRPDVKVGDRWNTTCKSGVQTFNFVTVVTSVDQTGVKGTQNGKPLTLSPDLNNIESPQRKASNERGLSFPLQVGKQWEAANEWVSHIDNEASGTEKLTVTVVGYERVRVRAGEFDAFKLKWKSNWWDKTNNNPGTTESTYWYAPAARTVVWLDELVSWPGGGKPELTCELVEFQLQP